MERLCISSFLRNGHQFRLYCYEPLEGVPEGAEILDGEEILPRSSIFQYADRDSFADFEFLSI